MKANRIIQKSIIPALLVVVLGAFASLLAIGGGEVKAAGNALPKYSLQIAPTSLRADNLLPGQVHTGTITVTNTGQEPIDFEMIAQPYYVDSEYRPDYETKNNYTQIARWVEFDQDVAHLAPLEKANVGYTVTVPKNAPGGGQYAAISARAKVGEMSSVTTGKTEIVESIGIVLAATVQGDTHEVAKITDNSVPSLLFSPPIKTHSAVENSGNVDFYASYKLTVTNLFGDTIKLDEQDSDQVLMVLPGTTRNVGLQWKGAPHLGIFWVTQEVKALNETSTEKHLVILMPAFLLVILIVLIVLAITGIVIKVKRKKTHRGKVRRLGR